jgi:ArsR family transcriptional regulator
MIMTATLPHLLKILADDIRLRVLGLLAREELGVGELARILGLSPSRLANHLRILREAELVLDRREGTWRFVRLNRNGALPSDLWDVVESHLEESPGFAADCRLLGEVLDERRERSRSYFDRVAPVWDTIGSDFRTGVARQRVAAQLVPPDLVVADVGSGTGYLASALVGLAHRVILVDHSPAMLESARSNLENGRGAVEFREGELDALPLEDQEVHAVLAGMVLHHVPDLSAFLAEAWRVLKPRGVLVIEDLLPHREGWMREHMADLRLGIDPDDLKSRLALRGFEAAFVEPLEDSYTPRHPEGEQVLLPLFLLRAIKPRQESNP